MATSEASQSAQTLNKQDVDFFIYRAKIEPCCRTEPHSHSSCPYLHPDEGCPRRDPLLYKYDSVFCYDLHNTKVCKRGVNCPYSHNLFEYFLHPSRYRTRMCEFGDKCKRELCFFAHSETELRERTAIKTHSGGRRSGKRHRAAMAMRAANRAASPTSTSVGLCFLQVPNMPFSDASSGSNTASSTPLQLDAAVQDPLSCLGLTDMTAQQAGFASAAMPQLQLAQTAPLLILQDGSGGSSVELLSNMAYVPASTPVINAGNAPLGMGMLPGSNSAFSALGGLAVNNMQPSAPLVISTQALGQGASMLSLASSQAMAQSWPGNLLLTSNSGQAPGALQQDACFLSAGSAHVGQALASMPATLQAMGPSAPAGGYILVAADQIGSALTCPAFQVQQQMDMLAPAGILPQSLPSTVAGQPTILLLKPMQQL